MCDLLEIFTWVNKRLLDLEEDKVKRNKKTSRHKISTLFKEVTEILLALDQLLKTVTLTPFNELNDNTPPHTIWGYYMTMGSFERIEHDTRITKSVSMKNVYDRMMPIISKDDKTKVTEIKVNINKFILKAK